MITPPGALSLPPTDHLHQDGLRLLFKMKIPHSQTPWDPGIHIFKYASQVILRRPPPKS